MTRVSELELDLTMDDPEQRAGVAAEQVRQAVLTATKKNRGAPVHVSVSSLRPTASEQEPPRQSRCPACGSGDFELLRRGRIVCTDGSRFAAAGDTLPVTMVACVGCRLVRTHVAKLSPGEQKGAAKE